jgi:dipeptidyl aminopeptidase/acylaminoacyl peptidase
VSPESPPVWERRYRAPTILFPAWSPDAPERFAVCSNETESYQAYSWDRRSGARLRLTDDPVGITYATPTADGTGVAWFLDENGDEFGRWMVDAFDGDAESRRPLAPGVPDGWPSGLALGPGVTAIGVGGRDGFSVHVVTADGNAREVFRHSDYAGVGDEDAMGFNTSGLSRDGRLLCVFHSEHGDNLHWALRVYDTESGGTVADLWDGPGKGLAPAAWSPVPGDARLAITHERTGVERPAIWNVATGEREDIEVDLPGDVFARDWWPDGSALLFSQLHEGSERLFRHHLADGSLTPIGDHAGAISAARVRPDGEVWLRVSTSEKDARVVTADGGVIVAPEGDGAPDGRTYRSWFFENPKGERVHGFVAIPPGDGPHPVVMDVHGGPHLQVMDSFSPRVQALVDAGFAVGLVNYRGSTGYGSKWRDAIIGNPGLPELEDVVAGLDSLVAQGIADPERAVVAGGSWGGYITLLAIGKHPGRWAAAAAGVPVADYVAAYEDEAPSLQAMDRALFGGTPDEMLETYEERSPVTFAAAVRTPLLILAGENDSRCPIRQIDNYVKALEARGRSVEVYRYDTGHSSFVTDERVRQMRRILEFLEKNVPAR